VKAGGIRFAEKLEREKFRGDEESTGPAPPAPRRLADGKSPERLRGSATERGSDRGYLLTRGRKSGVTGGRMRRRMRRGGGARIAIEGRRSGRRAQARARVSRIIVNHTDGKCIRRSANNFVTLISALRPRVPINGRQEGRGRGEGGEKGILLSGISQNIRVRSRNRILHYDMRDEEICNVNNIHSRARARTDRPTAKLDVGEIISE